MSTAGEKPTVDAISVWERARFSAALA